MQRRIGILVDTKGPEVRIRGLSEPLTVVTRETVTIPKVDEVRKDCSGSCDGFMAEAPAGSRILMDDGAIELVVKNSANGVPPCEAMNDGTIKVLHILEGYGGTPGQSETTNFLEINAAAPCLGQNA